MQRVIVITGINGFLGRNLAKFCRDKKCYVVGTVSSSDKVTDSLNLADQIIVHNLNQPNEIEYSFNYPPDFIFYCAYDAKSKESNVSGTIAFHEKITKYKECWHIFISSVSVDEKNGSSYADVKRQLENYFIKIQKSILVRPGLIIGDGGLFVTMKNFVKKNRLVPLPDGGIYEMAVISLGELLDELYSYVNNPKRGIKNLYRRDFLSLRKIVKDISKELGKRIFIINIPINLIELLSPFVIFILKTINININFDSIIGYKLYRNLKLPKSDLIFKK